MQALRLIERGEQLLCPDGQLPIDLSVRKGEAKGWWRRMGALAGEGRVAKQGFRLLTWAQDECGEKLGNVGMVVLRLRGVGVEGISKREFSRISKELGFFELSMVRGVQQPGRGWRVSSPCI
jgi:hypothetical protein